MSNKGLYLEYIKSYYNSITKTQSNLKIGKECGQFPKEDIQEAHEKMLNITNY